MAAFSGKKRYKISLFGYFYILLSHVVLCAKSEISDRNHIVGHTYNIMKELKIGNLNAEVPIVQGGMGVGISLSGLASAVANAGGVGQNVANGGLVSGRSHRPQGAILGRLGDGDAAEFRQIHRHGIG